MLHDAGIETLNVYIYSDEAHRAECISGYLNTTDTAEIVRAMKKKDRARRSYCKQHTGQIYGDSRNYDLTLCTSKLGLDKAEEILLCAAKEL